MTFYGDEMTLSIFGGKMRIKIFRVASLNPFDVMGYYS